MLAVLELAVVAVLELAMMAVAVLELAVVASMAETTIASIAHMSTTVSTVTMRKLVSSISHGCSGCASS